MLGYKIVGDSCTDFTDEHKKNKHFCEVPLTLSLGEYAVTDDDNFDPVDFIERMKKSEECPKSSCPSPADYMHEFDCDDDVYAVTLSDKLSGSYNSAVQAKGILSEEKSKKNIHIFSSFSASVGQLLIALKIEELAGLGQSFQSVVEGVNDFIQKQKIFFVLENLDVLRKNGRLNPLQSVITNVLNVKLVMTATDDGHILKFGQALTLSRAISKLIETVEKHASNCSDKILAITHCNCLERATFIKDEILKRCKFKDSLIVESGGISTMYANDGGIIISF